MENLFIGEYSYNMDIKGRMNFPTKIREELGETFIITKGLDNCLFIFSMDEWKRLADEIKSLPRSKSVAMQRFYFGSAQEILPDKQGRILISQNLREYAGIEKDVVVVGALNRAEIWSKEKWKNVCDELSPESIAEVMEELGF